MEVGLREVAALAGVSVGTVSNVVNGRASVAQEYVDRVNEAVLALGFVRNDAARALRSGTSRTVGMVVPDGNNPFFSTVALAASDTAILDNNIVLVGTSHNEPKREARYVEAFAEQRARGIIISSTGKIYDRLDQFAKSGMPAILLDPDPDERFSSVTADDVLGGRIGVEHLIESGRRRIAFVGGPMSIRVLVDRLVGANQAVATTNGAVALQIFDTPDRTVLTGRRIGEQILSLPPDARPDAVFAMTDFLAIGLLQTFDANQVAVPQDIAIVGYDDIDFAGTTPVPLTSIRLPMEVIGRTAIQMLEAQRAEPSLRERRMVAPALVPRASSR